MLDSPPRARSRRTSRVALWNVLLCLFALLLIIMAGEVYLRRTVPFMASSRPVEFVPDVGFLYKPHSVVRYTNGVDFWTDSKVNSLGFLDREPIAMDRADESCHVTVIGDSFVEAGEVELASRFPVQLEDFAKRDLPELDVTVSAFGRGASGQIHHLPFYDHYARKMNPDFIVLVFVVNDFMDNSSFIRNLKHPWDPDRPPHAFAQRSASGEIVLYPPDPDYESHKILDYPPKFEIFPRTFVGFWFSVKVRTVLLNQFALFNINAQERMEEKVNILRDRPHYASLTSDWKIVSRGRLSRSLMEDTPLKVLQEALEFTAFGLDQFQERADRDGASLAILATESMSTSPRRLREKQASRAPIDLLRQMADAREIPVIDLYDFMLRQGGRIEEKYYGMHFAHDPHWNETGHRWAAEAILEYLKGNQAICGTQSAVEAVP